MASDSVRHDIQPLSKSGWTTWSFQVHGELASKRVWGIVNETRSKPATTDVDTFAKWTVDAECAAGVIMRYAGTDAATHLTDLEDPVEMWKQLKAAYNAPVPSARLVALRALLSARQMPEETLDQLATRIQELHRRFLGLQTTEFTLDKLNNELFAMGLVQAMGDSHESLQTSIILKEEIKKDEVLQALRRYSVTGGAHNVSSSPDTAYIASSSHRTPSGQATPSASSLHCSWCGTKTHNTDDCRSMARAREKRNKNSKQTAQAAEQVAEFAGTASRARSPSSTSSDTHWNPDTGATSISDILLPPSPPVAISHGHSRIPTLPFTLPRFYTRCHAQPTATLLPTLPHTAYSLTIATHHGCLVIQCHLILVSSVEQPGSGVYSLGSWSVAFLTACSLHSQGIWIVL
ncbi:hypothetical protein FRC20_004779 [Serendipita sp. 405]|nr:hypothetical protein FRC15_002895 [Serendipita sp. 397]KAG8841893.1 hypothetical protein FRC20_004779 [Serendipita sp. 405]